MRGVIDHFDPELLQAMGSAFDAVLVSLDDYGQPIVVRDVIRSKIVGLALAGERCPVRFHAETLKWFAPAAAQAD